MFHLDQFLPLLVGVFCGWFEFQWLLVGWQILCVLDVKFCDCIDMTRNNVSCIVFFMIACVSVVGLCSIMILSLCCLLICTRQSIFKPGVLGIPDREIPWKIVILEGFTKSGIPQIHAFTQTNIRFGVLVWHCASIHHVSCEFLIISMKI